MSRERLDVAVSRQAGVESRERARALILAGRVRVAGATERRPSRMVEQEAAVELVEPPRFVSRGGDKLEGALAAFQVDVTGRVCADVGASTGGFTDALLKRGAARVYAIDVGRGLIHWSLRSDPRVVLMERVNARSLESLPEPVSLVTVDVSFIGLEKVLPAVWRAAPQALVLALFKPQFQVPRGAVGKGGVVREPVAVVDALKGFTSWAEQRGRPVTQQAPAVIPGADGNQEWFLLMAAAAGGTG